MVEPLYRLLRAMRNYRNPLSIAFCRAIGSSSVRVMDRRTNLVFKCRRGADQMLAEIFNARIYDIPFVPIRPNDIVIDVGANHGFYSCLAAKQGAIVHAFEPDPNTYNLLIENITINGLGDRVFPHQYAIAAESGDSQMYCTSDLGGGMSTIIPAFAVKSGMKVVSQSKVKALSMVDALNHCGVRQVRVCKMDCEGAEQSILSKFDASLVNRFDAFVMEYHTEAYRLEQFMEMLLGWEGYHVSKVVSQDRDIANANLSIVRNESIREWCAATAKQQRSERVTLASVNGEASGETPSVKQHAVA